MDNFPINKQIQVSKIITKRITLAQNECKQLTLRLNKAKQQSKDSSLQLLASNCRQEIDKVELNCYRTLKGHLDKVSDVAWMPDNRHVVSASQDGFLLIWDATTGFKKDLIELDDPWVMCCGVSHDGRLVATGGLENACIVYKTAMGRGSRSPVGSNGSNGSSGSTGSSTMFSKNSILSIFKGHREYISGLSFLANSSTQIVTCSGDKSCVLWDTTKGGKISTFYGHLGDVLSISANGKDTNTFTTCSCDRMALVWDIRAPVSVRKFVVSNICDASAIQYFPDGNSFACGADDGTIKLFDLRSDTEIAGYDVEDVRKYVGKEGSRGRGIEGSIDNPGVMSIDFSRSGRLLFVSYGEFNDVIMRDSISGRILGSLGGHRDVVSRVRVSPDGMGVITGSRDYTVKVWAA